VTAPRVLVVEHQTSCPPGLVGRWLTEAGCALEVVRPYEGDALPEPGPYDGVVVLGGSMDSWDPTVPWLLPVRDLIRHAADREVPTLGVCLGHQLCALALGGEVGRSPHGQNVGLHELGLQPPSDLHGPVPALVDGAPPRRAVFWNDDVVTRLPDGARALALDADGEVQAAAFAPTVWGVQWHPEVADGVPDEWATKDVQRHTDRGIDQAARLREVAEARDELVAAERELAVGFAALAAAHAGGAPA
jgi:GMP synthase (glutamine-hydrolysing)